MKTNNINDINLDLWKNYEHIWTSSLWTIDKRKDTDGHTLSMQGQFCPQIPEQLIQRYSKAGDLIFDPMMGYATTGIEAVRLGRQFVGIDLDRERVLYAQEKLRGEKALLIQTDSAKHNLALKIEILLKKHFQKSKVDLIILHPPYWDIVKFSDNPADLSNMKEEQFYYAFSSIITNCSMLLKEGGYIALVIGDAYKKGELIPISHECFSIMRRSFTPKAEIIKNIVGNEHSDGKNSNLWRYRCLKNGLYQFDHEKILLFQRTC